MERYRVRTWLRGRVPDPFVGLFPKGAGDCGAHEWYRSDARLDRCYHCEAGVREHVPEPLVIDGPEWRGLLDGVEHGSTASAVALRRRVEEHGTLPGRTAHC